MARPIKKSRACKPRRRRCEALMPDIGLVCAAQQTVGGDGVHAVQYLLHRYLDACERGQPCVMRTCEQTLRRKMVEIAVAKTAYRHLWDQLLYGEKF